MKPEATTTPQEGKFIHLCSGNNNFTLRPTRFFPFGVCSNAPTCPPSRENSAATFVACSADANAGTTVRMPMDCESRITAASMSFAISADAAGFDDITGLFNSCRNSCSTNII